MRIFLDCTWYLRHLVDHVPVAKKVLKYSGSRIVGTFRI